MRFIISLIESIIGDIKVRQLVLEGRRLDLREDMYNFNTYENTCTLYVAKKLSGRSDKEVIKAFLRYGWEPGEVFQLSSSHV